MNSLLCVNKRTKTESGTEHETLHFRADDFFQCTASPTRSASCHWKKILRGGKNGYYQMLWRTTIITSFFVCFAYFFFVCPSPRGMLYIQRLQLSAFFKCILLDYYSKCLYVFSDAFLRRGKMRGGCLVLCGSNIETRGNTFCGKSCRFLPQSSIYEE